MTLQYKNITNISKKQQFMTHLLHSSFFLVCSLASGNFHFGSTFSLSAHKLQQKIKINGLSVLQLLRFLTTLFTLIRVLTVQSVADSTLQKTVSEKPHVFTEAKRMLWILTFKLKKKKSK